MDVINEIVEKFVKGTKIPKPVSEFDYRVKGWGLRRGEKALIYLIPNHKNPKKPHEKGITVTEFQIAFERIQSGKDLDRKWFEETLVECNKEGTCNFTTLGEIFQELSLVRYNRPGVYKTI